jgi:hypothetical protein
MFYVVDSRPHEPVELAVVVVAGTPNPFRVLVASAAGGACLPSRAMGPGESADGAAAALFRSLTGVTPREPGGDPDAWAGYDLVLGGEHSHPDNRGPHGGRLVYLLYGVAVPDNRPAADGVRWATLAEVSETSPDVAAVAAAVIRKVC